MKPAKNTTIIYKIFIVLLMLLTGLSFIKSIFISFDLDEGYALAQGVRMAMGDHLFNQMWEPHQLSAYPVALLAKLYMTLTGGTTGIIIFLRTSGCLVHAVIGGLLYYAYTSYTNKYMAAILSLIHCLFLPKWVQLPEFELMQYWYLMLVFVCFTICYKRQKMQIFMLILSGLFTLLMMTCYPTMCILFVPGLILIYKSAFKKWRDMGLFAAGFFGSGILVLIYIFAYISPLKFVTNLKYIFMDESHTTETGLSKTLLFAEQIGSSLIINIICILISFMIVSLFICIIKKRDFSSSLKIIILCTLTASASFLLLADFVSVAFFDVNIFVFTHFYYSAIAACIYGYIAFPECRMKIPYISLFLSGILSLVAISLMTNMSINVIISHCFPVIPAVILMVSRLEVKQRIYRDFCKISNILLIVSLLSVLLFSRLIAIRVNGCLPVTIRAGLERMDKGPLAGIYVVDDDAYYYKGLMDIVDAHAESDRLLYIGGETWLYAYKPSGVCSASTQGTSSYNDAFIAYYDVHPDLLPDMIMIDTRLGVNPAYNTTTVSQSMYEWIEAVYPHSYEGDENFAKVYIR